jgi:hypothetical protein
MLDLLPHDIVFMIFNYIKNPLYLRSLNKRCNIILLKFFKLDLKNINYNFSTVLLHRFNNLINVNNKLLQHVSLFCDKNLNDKIIGLCLNTSIPTSRTDFPKYNRLKIINVNKRCTFNLPTNFYLIVPNITDIKIRYTDKNFSEILKIKSLKYLKLYYIPNKKITEKHINFFSQLLEFSLYMGNNSFLNPIGLPKRLFDKLSKLNMIGYEGAIDNYDFKYAKYLNKLKVKGASNVINISYTNIKKLTIYDYNVIFAIHINDNIEKISFECTGGPKIIGFNNLPFYKNLNELNFLFVSDNEIDFDLFVRLKKLGINF